MIIQICIFAYSYRCHKTLKVNSHNTISVLTTANSSDLSPRTYLLIHLRDHASLTQYKLPEGRTEPVPHTCICSPISTLVLMSACDSEQDAAAALGYTQVTWDNLSGREQKPWSFIKSWAALGATEKAAAVLLGYTQTSWDDELGTVPRPASAFKRWSELTKCGDGEKTNVCLHLN